MRDDRDAPDVQSRRHATPNPGGFPIGGQTRIRFPNDHLQYAITWGSLALALIVIYVISSRSNGAGLPVPTDRKENP